MNRKIQVKMMSLLLSCLLLGSVFTAGLKRAQAAEFPQDEGYKPWDTIRYSEYIAAQPSALSGEETIVLDGSNLLPTSSKAIEVLEQHRGKSGELISTKDDSIAGYSFTVSSPGLYQIRLSYCPLPGTGEKISRTIYLDGEIPFREAAEIKLDRVWTDQDGKYYRTDAQGNQLRAEQVETFQWTEQDVCDPTGVVNVPLHFYLSAGSHELRLVSVKESAVIEKIILQPVKAPVSYQQYRENGDRQYGVRFPAEAKLIQAEEMSEKSAPSLFGSSERGTAGMQPESVEKTLINQLSGVQFTGANDWVTYRFSLKESGYYKLAFKYKQAYKDAGFSSRRILINGVVPFEEADSVRFPYSDGWDTLVVGKEEQPYYFYFQEGENTITLQAVTGDLSDIIGTCQQIIDELNQIYRRLFIITGPDPDPFRDYDFAQLAPEEMKALAQKQKELETVKEQIVSLTGQSGSYISSIERLVLDISKMVEQPDSVAHRLKNFVANLGSLSEWVLSLQAQPLDLDYIELVPDGKEPTKSTAGFFQNFWHQLRMFFLSFSADYNGITGGSEEERITVWLGETGRDQAHLIKQLIDEKFVPQSGIPVKLQFVTGALLPSTLAGIGPDVYLFAAASDPINYAIRGAVLPLNDFDDFDDMTARFTPGAMKPFTYQEKTYALPETVQYPMMFYRKDIFDELNLKIPQTWEDMYDVIARLQTKNLTVAIPADISGYYMLLYQDGGSVFQNDGKSVAFDTKTGVSAFYQWTRFFTEYKLSVSYSFINRFRTGEMPIGIADFTTANQLNVSAPEIRGMWGMIPVPGTLQEDGSIDRSVVLTGTANIIMRQSEKREQAWKFLKWWSSAEIQSDYAKQLESIMGVAARYPTANTEAFMNQAWAVADRDALVEQRQSAVGIPEVPGSYIIPRYLNFSFSAVVDEGSDPGEEIMDYSKMINAELERKQKEFSRKMKESD